ncbi:MAG: hypothetical protein J7559_12895, partial [Cohnella sp.]|nr:hypothetical protein [Cohnella sp.]
PRVEPRFSIVDSIMPQLDRLEEERLSQSAEDMSETQVVVPPIRSERPRGRLMRRFAGVVAAGIVAGLLLISQQIQLSNDDSDKDAAAPDSFANSALSARGTEYAVTMEDGDAPAAAPQASAAEPSPAPKMAPEMQGGGAAQETPAVSGLTIDNGSAASIPEHDIERVEVADQYGVNVIVTPTADSVEGATSKSSDAKSISGLSAQATALVSPDGQWRAVAIEGDGTLRIFSTKDDSLVFESELRKGSLTRLAWDPESNQLTYTLTDEQGNSTNFAYNADEMREFTP